MKELGQAQPRKVLLVNSAVTFLGFLDTPLLIPVIALYAAELGAGVGTIGLIVGLYSLTNTPANILVGRLIDKWGYKLPLTLGLIGDAVSMFLYSLCRLPVHLALVRTLHGISGGLVAPATMSIAAHYSDRARRGRTMGIYGMSLAAATLVGHGLSGVIVSRLGYDPLFLIGALLVAVAVALSLLIPAAGKRDGEQTESQSGRGLAQAKSLLRRKGLTLAYSTIFAQYFAFGGAVTLLPLYVKGLGMDTFHVGMLLATFSAVFIILQVPSGALSDRVGRLMPIAGGLSLSIIALVALPSMATFPLLALIMALYGTAYGMLFPSVSALVADHTAPEERGMAMGVFHASLTAGVGIGAPLIGYIGGLVGVGYGLMLTSGVTVLALVLVLVNLRRV